MYDYIFWDLDGTLTDSAPGITKGAAYALKHFGIEVEDLSTLRKFVGPTLSYSFREYYDFDEAQIEEAVKKYREYYSEIGLFENAPYEGIKELLAKVKADGKKMIVATGKPEEFSRRILDKFELTQYFDLIVGATMDESRNTKEDIVAYALEKLGEPDRDKCVMIGDRKFDVNGAKANNMKCIGVLYGFGDREELNEAGADYIADTVLDIAKFL